MDDNNKEDVSSIITDHVPLSQSDRQHESITELNAFRFFIAHWSVLSSYCTLHNHIQPVAQTVIKTIQTHVQLWIATQD